MKGGYGTLQAQMLLKNGCPKAASAGPLSSRLAPSQPSEGGSAECVTGSKSPREVQWSPKREGHLRPDCGARPSILQNLRAQWDCPGTPGPGRGEPQSPPPPATSGPSVNRLSLTLQVNKGPLMLSPSLLRPPPHTRTESGECCAEASRPIWLASI